MLTTAVRAHPVEGAARDANGVRRRVHVDEVQLAAIDFLSFFNFGELPAAADALTAGDPRPLLRLASETPLWPGGDGDPAEFSSGGNVAAYCSDQDPAWNRRDPLSVRRAKYERELARLPPAQYAPLSKHAVTTLYPPELCLLWPAPDRFTPAVPAGATAGGVPALLVSGDLDMTVPTSVSLGLRAVFPAAPMVHIAGGHDAAAWGQCPATIARRFLRSPRSATPDVPAHRRSLRPRSPSSRSPPPTPRRPSRRRVTVP